MTSTVVVYPHAATILASIFACIFVVVGFLGNIITILALLRNSKLRSHATTAFVLSLCVSDLLFCGFSLPLTALRYIHQAWILGDEWCKLFAVIFYSNVAVSLLSITGITLNRYILIACHKHYAKIYQPWSVALQLSIIWILSISVMIPPLLGKWGRLGLQVTTFSCTILRDDNGNSIKKYLFAFGFWMPCVVIITCYLLIYWIVTKQRQKLDKHNAVTRRSSGSNRIRDKEDSRLTFMMLIIFICFVVCYFPSMVVNVTMEDHKYPWIHILSSILTWASSALNPFLYAASNRTYRIAYYKLLSPLKCWGEPLTPMSSKTLCKGSRECDQR